MVDDESVEGGVDIVDADTVVDNEGVDAVEPSDVIDDEGVGDSAVVGDAEDVFEIEEFAGGEGYKTRVRVSESNRTRMMITRTSVILLICESSFSFTVAVSLAAVGSFFPAATFFESNFFIFLKICLSCHIHFKNFKIYYHTHKYLAVLGNFVKIHNNEIKNIILNLS
jgi:hypothetical protein